MRSNLKKLNQLGKHWRRADIGDVNWEHYIEVDNDIMISDVHNNETILEKLQDADAEVLKLFLAILKLTPTILRVKMIMEQ